jgi:hypothetical protein
MLTFKSHLKLICLSVLILTLSFCKKPAGPGGRATVKGKVWARDFDNQTRSVLSNGYAVDERVYIIYGTGNVIGNDVRTGPDGSFEFRYLNKGHYKVYVNSLDTSVAVQGYKGNDTYHSVIKEFDITGASETKTLEDFKIAR